MFGSSAGRDVKKVGHGVSGANGSAQSGAAPTAGRPELLRTGRSTELLNALQSMEERISDRLQLNVNHQVLCNVIFLLSYVTCAIADFLCICSIYFLSCLFVARGQLHRVERRIEQNVNASIGGQMHSFLSNR